MNNTTRDWGSQENNGKPPGGDDCSYNIKEKKKVLKEQKKNRLGGERGGNSSRHRTVPAGNGKSPGRRKSILGNKCAEPQSDARSAKIKPTYRRLVKGKRGKTLKIKKKQMSSNQLQAAPELHT